MAPQQNLEDLDVVVPCLCKTPFYHLRHLLLRQKVQHTELYIRSYYVLCTFPYKNAKTGNRVEIKGSQLSLLDFISVGN